MIRKLDKQGFDEVLRKKEKPIAVEFTTVWCPYCQRLAPIIEYVAIEHANEIEVYAVDTDDQPDLAEKYDIMTVPTVIVFLNGEIQKSAVNPRTKKALLDLMVNN